MTAFVEPFAVARKHPGLLTRIEYVNKSQVGDFTFDVGWIHRAWPEGHSANTHNYRRYERRLTALLECARSSR